MATWQFDLCFNPIGAPASASSKDGWEAPPLPPSVAYGVQEDLAHYFGPPWLMLDDWIVFGPENGNRVDLLFENDGSAGVYVRCDTRDDGPQFLVLITDLARIHQSNFYSPSTKELIEPDRWQIQAAMTRSMSTNWN